MNLFYLTRFLYKINIKNYPYNVYKKVFDSNFYVEYFNRDVNRVYELKSFKPFKKIIYETNVKSELLNSTVFSLDIEEPYYLKNLINPSTVIQNNNKFCLIL